MWFWQIAIALIVLCASGSAHAVEIHTLVDKHCRALSGVVVGVDEELVMRFSDLASQLGRQRPKVPTSFVPLMAHRSMGGSEGVDLPPQAWT